MTAVAIPADVRVADVDASGVPGAPIDAAPAAARVLRSGRCCSPTGSRSSRSRRSITIPSALGKLLTQGALALAAVLVLVFNRRRLVRPNLFVALFTVLAASSLMMSVRLVTGPGSLFRAGRFCAFIAVLWLLTPLWGRARPADPALAHDVPDRRAVDGRDRRSS